MHCFSIMGNSNLEKDLLKRVKWITHRDNILNTDFAPDYSKQISILYYLASKTYMFAMSFSGNYVMIVVERKRKFEWEFKKLL